MKINQRWLELRRELYVQTRQQVEKRLGRDAADLMRYRKEFECDFGGAWRKSNQTSLLKEMREAHVIYMGDFHPLAQAQKAHVRLLRKLLVQKNRKPLAIAVECIESRHQKVLDRFLAGEITEEQFLAKVRWEKSWGFPWVQYRALFVFARKHNISMLALNKSFPKRSRESLQRRDQVAGELIAKWLKSHPDFQLFVIYGDLHLSKTHIPKEVQRNLGRALVKSLTIFQNPESFYFRVLEKSRRTNIDLVKMASGVYCLLSVPPWVLWQNYHMYVESHFDQPLAYEQGQWDSDDDDLIVDYSDHVARQVRFISQELGLKIPTDSLSVFSIHDDVMWDKIDEVYSDKDVRLIRLLAEGGFSFYLPEIEAGYLANPTVNHASGLAMMYIHDQFLKRSEGHEYRSRFLLNFPRDFEALVWHLTVAYLGIKIVNHQMKSDTLLDVKQALMQKNSEADSDVLQLTLAQKMKELMKLSGRGEFKQFPRKVKPLVYYKAADILSGMLGEKFYFGYRSASLTKANVKMLLGKDCYSLSFVDTYYELLEVIDSLPAPFFTKQEKL